MVDGDEADMFDDSGIGSRLVWLVFGELAGWRSYLSYVCCNPKNLWNCLRFGFCYAGARKFR